MDLFNVLANVFTVIGNIIDCVCAAVLKDKEKLIISNLMSSTCTLITMTLLMSMSGVIGVLVTLARLITIYIKDKKHMEMKLLFILFLVLYGMVFFDKNKIAAFTVFASNMCAFLPKWFSKDIQKVRIGGICSCVFALWHRTMVGNYAALPFLVIAIITTTFGYIHFRNKENDICTIPVSTALTVRNTTSSNWMAKG